MRAAGAGRLKFSSFDDLVGHDVAVLRGAAISPEFWIFVHEHRNLTETASDEANFRMLQAGRVDYVVASLVSGARLIGSLGLDGKVQPLLSRSLEQDDLYAIFSRQRVGPAFIAAFSDALHQFKHTEAFRAIYRKYFAGLLTSPPGKSVTMPRSQELGADWTAGRSSAALDRRRITAPHPSEPFSPR